MGVMGAAAYKHMAEGVYVGVLGVMGLQLAREEDGNMAGCCKEGLGGAGRGGG